MEVKGEMLRRVYPYGMYTELSICVSNTVFQNETAFNVPTHSILSSQIPDAPPAAVSNELGEQCLERGSVYTMGYSKTLNRLAEETLTSRI